MFPSGHDRDHRHHGRGEEEEAERRRREERGYPPPGYQPYNAGDRPHHHHGGPDYSYSGNPYQNPYPPANHGAGYDSGPGFPAVQHVAHELGPGPYHGAGYDSRSDLPSVEHLSHESRPGSYQRPLPSTIHRKDYDPNPNFPSVQHVAHESGTGSYQRPYPSEEGGRRHQENRDRDDFPFVQHISHDISGSDRAPANRRTVRIFTKADENYSLSIRDGKVILARSNPNDEYQHWIKDEKFSTRVKDQEGFPSFALVNKVTGEAIKHSIGATHHVRLIPHNPNFMDESVLWTESRDTGEGFRCIRMVNNINLNFDAFHGDEDHGGVHDGTTIVLWEWVKGKNQRWKIAPY